jgi:maltose O-acetyltransferase
MNDSTQQAPESAATPDRPALLARLATIFVGEFENIRWKLLLCTLLARLLPEGRVTATRTRLVRAVGVGIGDGTRFMGMPKIQSSPPGPLGPRLQIGANCLIGTNVILEFGEVVTIGDRTSIADGVVVLTTTHQLGPREHRAGPVVRTPVVIGSDVIIGAESIVLPGATIGDAARVLPNSVVNATVAPGVTVGGIPARPIRSG